MKTCHRNFVMRRNRSATTPISPPSAIKVLSVILGSIVRGGGKGAKCRRARMQNDAEW